MCWSESHKSNYNKVSGSGLPGHISSLPMQLLWLSFRGNPANRLPTKCYTRCWRALSFQLREFTSPCLILAEYFSFKWPKSRLYMSLQIFSRYIQRLQRSFLTQLWSSCKYKHPGEALDCQTWDPSRYWGLVRGHLVSCFEVNHAR